MRAMLIAIIVACATPALGDSISDANAAYVRGDYEAAIRGYEAAIASGVRHQDVYYNAGNAYFRAGKLGLAIYNYERALSLDPELEDAVYNVAVARAAVAGKVKDRLEGAETPSRWVRLFTWLSMSTLTVLFLVGNVLLFSLLTLLRFIAAGFSRTFAVVIASFAAVAFLAITVLFVGRIYLQSQVDSGVILPDQVVLREGRDSESVERGQLHAGLMVRIIERRDEWLRVRLSNGVEGWLLASDIGRL